MMDMKLGLTGDIIAECQRQGLLRNQAAYVLATAYWETARTMDPVREAFWLSEDWRKSNLRYYPWYGRGLVQLTWEANYVTMGARLGLDLTADPDVVMNPDVSVKILVLGMQEGLFTGKALGQYITIKTSNYRGARRIVNGTDKAGPIAEIAEEYEAALLAMGYGVEAPATLANDRKDGTPPRKTAAQSTTMQMTLVAFLASLGQVMDQAKQAVAIVSNAFGVSPEMAMFVVSCGALAWIFRERLKAWAGGWK